MINNVFCNINITLVRNILYNTYLYIFISKLMYICCINKIIFNIIKYCSVLLNTFENIA